MSKSAVILCLNGRRRTIKFTPNSTIAQIIEDVCAKEKIDSSAYDLRTSRTILDRTLPWMFTNLPNNAKLELCPRNEESQVSSAVVKIAFQLPDNQRLTAEFSSNTFLSDIVRHFSPQLQSYAIENRDGIPVINYMRQKLIGNDEFASTSLQNLGIIKGNALLRFSFESSTDQSLGFPSTHTKTANVGENASLEEKPNFKVQSPSRTGFEKPSHSNAVTPKAKFSPKASPKLPSQPAPRSASKTPPVVDIPMHDSDSESERRVKPPTLVDAASAPSGVNHFKFADANHQVDKASFEKKVKRKSATVEAVSQKRSRVEVTASRNENATLTDFSNFKFPTETQGVDLQRRLPPSTENIDLLSMPCDRKTILFNENERVKGQTVSAEEADDFFEVTVDDLRKMMADLKHERKKLEEQEMLTEEQRKSRKLLLAAKYPALVIRIVLPDRLILQGFFRPFETVKSLYDFVLEHINVKSFYLFTTPPKKILKDRNALLFDNNLAPAARVYFGAEKAHCVHNLVKESSSHLLRSVEEANEDLQSLRN